jgi:hypothetical protein
MGQRKKEEQGFIPGPEGTFPKQRGGGFSPGGKLTGGQNGKTLF